MLPKKTLASRRFLTPTKVSPLPPPPRPQQIWRTKNYMVLNCNCQQTKLSRLENFYDFTITSKCKYVSQNLWNTQNRIHLCDLIIINRTCHPLQHILLSL